MDTDNFQEKAAQLFLDLQELTECPVCLDTMDSSLRQCVSGHGVCVACANLLEECPTCGQSFAVHKNVLMMKILDRLPKSCSYADKGCNNLVFDQEHKNFCQFRPFKCLKTACDWVGCVKDLLQHVKECYDVNDLCQISSSNVEQQQILYCDETKTIESTIPIIYGDQLFFSNIELHRNVEPGKIAILYRCYYVPTSKQISNYYLSISFKKDNFEFKFTIKIYPEEKIMEKSLLETGNGLVMSESDLVRFKKPESNNQYVYTIKLFSDDIVHSKM